MENFNSGGSGVEFRSVGNLTTKSAVVDTNFVSDILKNNQADEKLVFDTFDDIESNFAALSSSLDPLLSIQRDNLAQYDEVENLKKKYSLTDDDFSKIDVRDFSNPGQVTKYTTRLKKMLNDPAYKRLATEQSQAAKYREQVAELESVSPSMALLAKKDYLENYVSSKKRQSGAFGFDIDINKYVPLDVDKVLKAKIDERFADSKFIKTKIDDTGRLILVQEGVEKKIDKKEYNNILDGLVDELSQDPAFANNLKAYKALNGGGNLNSEEGKKAIYDGWIQSYLQPKITEITTEKIRKGDIVVGANGGLSNAEDPSTYSSELKLMARMLPNHVVDSSLETVAKAILDPKTGSGTENVDRRDLPNGDIEITYTIFDKDNQFSERKNKIVLKAKDPNVGPVFKEGTNPNQFDQRNSVTTQNLLGTPPQPETTAATTGVDSETGLGTVSVDVGSGAPATNQVSEEVINQVRRDSLSRANNISEDLEIEDRASNILSDFEQTAEVPQEEFELGESGTFDDSNLGSNDVPQEEFELGESGTFDDSNLGRFEEDDPSGQAVTSEDNTTISFDYPATVFHESGTTGSSVKSGIRSGIYSDVKKDGKKLIFSKKDWDSEANKKKYPRSEYRRAEDGVIQKREESWGIFQYNKGNGLLKDFIDFAKDKGYKTPPDLSNENIDKWFKDNERLNNFKFAKDQEDFFKKNRVPSFVKAFNTSNRNLSSGISISFESLNPAVQDTIVGTYNQFGIGGGGEIIRDTFSKTISSEKDFIKNLSEARRKRAKKKLDGKTLAAVLKRINLEEESMLNAI